MTHKHPRRAPGPSFSPDAAAAELLALAEQQPENREEILQRAAALYEEAGEYDSAVQTYDVLLAGECADRNMVAAYRIGALHDAGREDELRAAATELRARHPRDWAPWHFVAETFEAAGDPRAAADWCTVGISHLAGPGTPLTDSVITDARLDDLLVTRHRVRRVLAEPHDDWDEAADRAHAQRADFIGGSGHTLDELHDLTRQSALSSDDPDKLRAEIERLTEEVAQRRAHLNAPRMTCVLYWPQEEFDDLLRHHPGLVEHYGDDHTEHLVQVEKLLRNYSDQGLPRLGTAGGALTGLASFARDERAELTDASVRAEYGADLARRGLAEPWPPPRNGPCWCSSGRKYKKCHGSPALG